MQGIKPAILARLQWIETALRTGRKIPSARYMEYFHVSQPKLSRDLQIFLETVIALGGDATRLHGTVRVDVWPDGGCVGTIAPLDWHRLVSPQSVEDITQAEVPAPSYLVQEIITSALQDRQVIEIGYTSTTSGERKVRISPHTLVYTAGRPHVRAYDHDQNMFRDYVLMRISQAIVLPDIVYVPSDSDQEWNKNVEIVFTVSNDLPEETRTSIARGLGLSDANTSIKCRCRACHVDYELLARNIRPEHYKNFFTYTLRDPSKFGGG